MPPPAGSDLYGVYNVAYLKSATSSTHDPGYGAKGNLMAPLQYEYSEVLTSTPYYRSQCGYQTPAWQTMFSSSGIERFPWYMIDLGALYQVFDVQLWFDASRAAWPSKIAVYITNTPPLVVGSSLPPAGSFNPCYLTPGADFTSYLEGLCNGEGRYVTAQLIGNATRAVTSVGTSNTVLRLCAFQVVGNLTVVQPLLTKSGLDVASIVLISCMCALAVCLIGVGLLAWRWRLEAFYNPYPKQGVVVEVEEEEEQEWHQPAWGDGRPPTRRQMLEWEAAKGGRR